MMKKWKIILLSGFLLIIGWITISYFIVDIRFLKEEYLIKRNYHKNAALFKETINIIDTLPSIDINYRGDSMIVFETTNQNITSETLENYSSDYPPTIWIYDDKMEFSIENYIYPLVDLKYTDSVLFVSTPDTLIEVHGEWKIKYDGYRDNEILTKILDIAQLDEQRLNDIQINLRNINCSGFEKNGTGNLIINYRTNYHLIDAFSYKIVSRIQDTAMISKRFHTKHGKLDDNIYWFYYPRIPVDYFGYLKLNNWNK